MVTRLVPSPGNLERSRWSLFHRPRWDDKTLGECANGNTRPQKKDQKTCVHIMLIFVRVLPVMNEGSRIETGHHHFPGCKKKQHRNILHYLLLTKHGTKFSLMCLLNVWDISFFIGKFPQKFQRVQLSLAAPWRSHERSAA